jgi:mannose-6-phosphate isomerase-like protein (cupin superfamily)
MADVTVKQVGDMESIFYGSFRRAGAELDVGSFGINVIDFPPDAGEGVYPDHDHADEGEEEVYLAWRGSGILTVEGEEIALDQDTAVRVGPTTKRKVRSGPDGLRLLILGGVPGEVYERRERYRLGAPDPAKQETGT